MTSAKKLKAKPTLKPTDTKPPPPDAPIEKNKGGKQPRVLTDEEIETVGRLSASCTVEQIGGYFGISERTFHEIKNRQPAVLAAYKKGKIKAISHVAGKLFDLINEGNVTATIFYLKTRGQWRETGLPVDSADEDRGAPPPILVRFAAKDSTIDMKEVNEVVALPVLSN